MIYSLTAIFMVWNALKNNVFQITFDYFCKHIKKFSVYICSYFDEIIFAIFVLSCWSLNVSNFIAKTWHYKSFRKIYLQKIWIELKVICIWNFKKKLMQQLLLNINIIAIFEGFVLQWWAKLVARNYYRVPE